MTESSDKWLSEAANQIQWQQQRNFYEVWFLKCHLNEGENALWVRYVLKNPGQGEGQLQVWAIWFDQEQAPVQWVETFPLSYLRVSQKFFFIQIGKSWLRHNSVYGSLANVNGAISWELDYEPQPTPVHMLPPWLRSAPLPRTKACTPHPDLICFGTVTINEQIHRVQEVPGMQGHLWGSRHADNWLWGHCNAFDQDPSAVLEVLSSCLRMGPVNLPRMSSVYLRFGEHVFLLNQPLQLLQSKITHQADGWSFVVQRKDWRISGGFQTDPLYIAKVVYQNPDGSTCPCRNSSLATVHVKVEQWNGKHWHLRAELDSQQMAAVEWGG